MKLTVLSLVALSLVTRVAEAEPYKHYTKDDIIIQSCKTAIAKTGLFDKKDAAKKYKYICNTPQGLGTFANCAYNNTHVYYEGVEKYIEEYCNIELKKPIDVEHIRSTYDNATKYIRNIMKDDDYNKTAIYNVPFEFNRKVYKNANASITYRWKNQDWTMWLGAGLIAYWAFIFVVAGGYNLLEKTIFVSKHMNSHPINLIRKHLILPATLPNKKHNHAFQILRGIGGLMPLRIESTVMGIYFVLVVVFNSVGYEFIPNNTIWPDRHAQMSRYVGVRSGILVCYSFCLTFLFAGRNNFLLWVTGWKQSTFLTYHKGISRINFLMLVLHAGAFHVNSWSLGKYETRMLTRWMRWGIISGVACGLIMITAMYSVRKNHYEIFLMTHIILVAIFLTGAWIHCNDFQYAQWCFAMAATWVFDRVVRLARLAYFGPQKAQMTVVSEEVIRVVVPRHKFWKPFPGSFGYLHYLTPTAFYQSHPFTIIGSDDQTITMVTKIKGGVTSMIHRQIRESTNATTDMRVLVEGPYGAQAPMHKYETALYYTGSTGIPSSYAYIQDSLKRGINQHIKLYWVIRNWNSLDWFYDELLSLKNTSVEVIVYITDPKSKHGNRHYSDSSSSSVEESEEKDVSKTESSDDTASSTNDEKAGMPSEAMSFIDFRMGRPNIEELIKGDLSETTGNVAVLSCGHNSMVDDIRYHVAQNLDLAKGRVEYVEELQAW